MFGESLDEGVLGREVIEQTTFGHVRRRGDGLECRGALALLEQDRHEGVEKFGAGGRGRWHGPIVRRGYCTVQLVQ